MRRRRIAWWLAGGLAVVAMALVAAGLIWPESGLGRLLSGAGLDSEQEPTVFPAEHVVPAGVALDMPALDGGQPTTSVTFEGLLNGWCTVYGRDPAHLDGVEYYAGTLRLEFEGEQHTGYCIDLERTLETGDSYEARLRVPAGAEMCPVYWILENYHHDQPGDGLLSREEGAAIQAAIWHYVAGFQPEWDAGCWCYKQTVYDRARAIIDAAAEQCAAGPDRMSLAVTPEVVPVGEVASVLATLTDSAGHPLAGRRVTFRTEIGTLAPAEGSSDAQGQVTGEVHSDVAGTARVTAISATTFPFGAVLPVDVSKQPVLIQNPTEYYAVATHEVTWVEAAAGAAVESFVAALMGDTAQVEWRTTREVAVSGFNLYHRADPSSSWTRLNEAPIASQGMNGGEYEWVHAAIDPSAEHYYLLEVAGGATGEQFGPVQAAHRLFLPLCVR